MPSYNGAFPGEVGKISGSSSQGIFLSYRREDSAPHASSLQLQLSQRLPGAQVFMDLDSIEPGLDFAEIIEQAVGSCAVLVAVIGRQWVTLTDERGDRRLDNPDDFVRFEVQTALQRGIRVIPVLVDGAKPLRQQDLPAELHKLPRLNAHTLSYSRYKYDTDQLVDLIQRVLAGVSEQEEAEQKGREKAREEAEQKAREEAEQKGREEAEQKAREEAEQKAREEAEQKAREEAEQKAREEAEQKARELATHYALASAAAEAGDWDQALSEFTTIADIDPGYRDVHERRENAHKQRQIARWQAEARQLHQAAQWAAVVEVGQQLHALDPAAADPDGLMTSARAQLADQEQTERLDADYETALRLIDAGDWLQAIATLERVAQVNPAYRATPVLLGRARRQLTDSDPAQSPKSASRPATAKNSEAESTPRLDRTLTGHTGLISRAVLSVAFSPDGRLLASSGEDKTVRLWDPATGTQQHVLTGHTGRPGPVHSVTFSPDGRLLASGGSDKTVRLWDPATGTQRRILTGHSQGVSSVAFSPDGRLLASGDDGVWLWDPAADEHHRTLTSDTWMVHTVAFSPDGRLLASGGSDKKVRLWDPATGTQQRILTGHRSGVHSVAFSPDGRLLASGGNDFKVRLWDPATGSERRILTGHSGGVSSVAFSPDGRLLASGGDKTVRLWDLATGEQRRTLSGHTGHVCSVAFSPDGRLLASGSGDKTVRLWDLT
jgi:WD40 repeat protein